MDYFEIYKTRCNFIGTDTSENRVINMTDSIERDFQNDPTYRKAIINFKEDELIDCRFSEEKNDLFKKYFLFKPSDFKRVVNGMYLKINEGTFIISESNMSELYKKSEAYVCNVTLKAKNLPDMPCFADNTTYGVKGLKDNGYYKESDKKLKIKVQANNITLKYFEGQRFLFGSNSAFINDIDVKNEWICYKINSKDFTVLENQYVLELTKTPLMPGKDDFINGVAWNDENIDFKNQEDKPTVDTKPSMNLKVEKLQISKSINISVQPNNTMLELKGSNATLEKIEEDLYKLTGIKKNGYAKLILKYEDKIIEQKAVLIY